MHSHTEQGLLILLYPLSFLSLEVSSQWLCAVCTMAAAEETCWQITRTIRSTSCIVPQIESKLSVATDRYHENLCSMCCSAYVFDTLPKFRSCRQLSDKNHKSKYSGTRSSKSSDNFIDGWHFLRLQFHNFHIGSFNCHPAFRLDHINTSWRHIFWWCYSRKSTLGFWKLDSHCSYEKNNESWKYIFILNWHFESMDRTDITKYLYLCLG